MRGRDKFRKYKIFIDVIVFFYSCFPKKLLKSLLVHHRKTQGKLGMAIRFAILKNLAECVGDNVSIHPDAYLFNVEKLSIGMNVSIHPMSYIEAYGGVIIESDVSIAHGASILSVTHNYGDNEIPIKDQGLEAKPIVISKNVWIGAKATILGGVTIGEGSIVGAGAVVTKDIEKNTIVAGIPASTIKERIK